MKGRITILGAGESGTGAAMLAVSKGYEVFVSDAGIIQPRYREQLIANGVQFEEKMHTLSRILDADFIIKSPGLGPNDLLVRMIAQQGKTMIDELEFAFLHTSGKIIAITGTNGKTTTTLLTYHILKESGVDVGLAGNVGHSMAAQLVDNDYEYWVVEISNFQLEYIDTFKPYIGVLLNITPDHLNRYGGNMEDYIAAKYRIIENMDSNDTFIYNCDDPILKSRPTGDGHAISVSVKGEGEIIHKDDLMVFNLKEETRISRKTLKLQGEHNLFNGLVAITIALKLGVTASDIEKALQTFKSPPHRLELITSIGGKEFYNDSKATNLDSVQYALGSFDNPVIWIAGGVDKGNDYNLIMDLVKGRVKALICLGVNNEKLIESFKDVLKNIKETTDIREAARMAYEYGENHDVVLLSPGCASFDLFKNYEDRGDQFRKAVEELKKDLGLN